MSKNENFEQMKLSTKLFFPATMICNPFCFLQNFFATNKKQNFKKEITFTTIKFNRFALVIVYYLFLIY